MVYNLHYGKGVIFQYNLYIFFCLDITRLFRLWCMSILLPLMRMKNSWLRGKQYRPCILQHLIRVYTVCSGISVPILRVIMVIKEMQFCLNPYLAFRDNSRAGGVCQLKSPSYLQYTTCNHSEQVFSYRSEPTFIQTRHFSLDSQVLDFTHTKKDREYQISSCH